MALLCNLIFLLSFISRAKLEEKWASLRMKRILVGITGFFVLLIASAALLPFFIDVNRYKPKFWPKRKKR